MMVTSNFPEQLHAYIRHLKKTESFEGKTTESSCVSSVVIHQNEGWEMLCDGVLREGSRKSTTDHLSFYGFPDIRRLGIANHFLAGYPPGEVSEITDHMFSSARPFGLRPGTNESIVTLETDSRHAMFRDRWTIDLDKLVPSNFRRICDIKVSGKSTTLIDETYLWSVVREIHLPHGVFGSTVRLGQTSGNEREAYPIEYDAEISWLSVNEGHDPDLVQFKNVDDAGEALQCLSEATKAAASRDAVNAERAATNP